MSQVTTYLIFNDTQTVSVREPSFSCSESLSDVTEVYMYPQMQPHPQCSRNLFRHW